MELKKPHFIFYTLLLLPLAINTILVYQAMSNHVDTRIDFSSPLWYSIIKESVIFFLLIPCAIRGFPIDKKWSLFAAVLLLSFSISATIGIGAGMDISIIAAGARTILPLFLIPAFSSFTASAGFLQSIYRFTCFFIAIIGISSIYQIFKYDPLYGATFLGARTYGLWTTPLDHGINIGAISSLLIFIHRKQWGMNILPWCFVLFLISVSTGNRTSMGCCLVLFVYISIASFTNPDGVISWRSGLVILSSFVFVLLISPVFSQAEFSGREDTSGSGYGMGDRLNMLQNGLDRGAVHFIFGEGPGISSNAAIALVGLGGYLDIRFADSFVTALLNGQGLFGVACFFYAIIVFAANNMTLRNVFIILITISLSISQVMTEIYPAGIIVCTLIGLSCAQPHTTISDAESRGYFPH